MSKPTKQEAEQDLSDISAEITALHEIRKWADWLSVRADVNSDYYRKVSLHVLADIHNGNDTKNKIIEYLKTL